MSRDASFWRNVTFIGGVHILALCALVRWSSTPRKALSSSVVWMDAGPAGQQSVVAAVNNTPIADPIPPFEAEEERLVDEQAETTSNSAMQSDIIVADATPPANSSPAPAVPTRTPKPIPPPSPKSSPKRIPKESAKLKAPLVAKASPVSSRPQPSATPAVKKKLTEEVTNEASPSPLSTDVGSAIAAAAKTGTAPTVGISGTGDAGTGGTGAGAGGASQFGWYGHMLHDRFFSQWAQPTSVVRSGARMSTLVKLRIEKDGRVSRFTILKPSGNIVVDDSVTAVGKRVQQVDALPSGLGDSYEVNINFELNSD